MQKPLQYHRDAMMVVIRRFTDDMPVKSTADIPGIRASTLPTKLDVESHQNYRLGRNEDVHTHESVGRPRARVVSFMVTG